MPRGGARQVTDAWSILGTMVRNPGKLIYNRAAQPQELGRNEPNIGRS